MEFDGNGARSIKKAVLPGTSQKPFAVKFIHKDYCIRRGRITLNQLKLEVSLHQHVAHHENIVQFMRAGEDETWKWIAMELAEGGDLFDKIESDVGVHEDIAHFYFTQLIDAVAYMHWKGVGHRDIKPENILLSSDGNLKIADFGLATLYKHNGKTKACTTSCGSPPYTAPEVLIEGGPAMGKMKVGYQADLVDIWSCGIVLFVLLVGNTPWDEPLERSFEFSEYAKLRDGLPDDELWHNLPSGTVSLIKGILQIDPQKRFSIRNIRLHPWFTRENKYIDDGGRPENPLGMATAMFEGLKVDLSQDVTASQRSHRSLDAMDIDDHITSSAEPSYHASTQMEDILFDWEPSQSKNMTSQASFDERLTEEPSFSQFSSTPQVPLTKTQMARRFGDILPAQSLTRFYSSWPIDRMSSAALSALQQLGFVSTGAGRPSEVVEMGSQLTRIILRGIDARNCPLKGQLAIEIMPGTDGLMLEVSFIKTSGDPVEWRRLFKKVVLMCKDAVFKPDEHMALLSQ